MPVSHLPGEAPVVRHVVVVSAEELPCPGTGTGVYPPTVPGQDHTTPPANLLHWPPGHGHAMLQCYCYNAATMNPVRSYALKRIQ